MIPLPYEMTDFESNLDCEIRFYSCEGDGVTEYDVRLAEHMERALHDFWMRHRAEYYPDCGPVKRVSWANSAKWVPDPNEGEVPGHSPGHPEKATEESV